MIYQEGVLEFEWPKLMSYCVGTPTVSLDCPHSKEWGGLCLFHLVLKPIWMQPWGAINGGTEKWGRENPDGVESSNVGISSFFHFSPAAMATSLAVSPGFGSGLTVDNSVQRLSAHLYICLTLVYFLPFPSLPYCHADFTLASDSLWGLCCLFDWQLCLSASGQYSRREAFH